MTWPVRIRSGNIVSIPSPQTGSASLIQILPHIKGDWARPVRVGNRMVYPKIKLEDWQCFILCVVFGWKLIATGKRRFKRVYIEVPRKNAKSTLSSGVANFMLTADDEPGAEVYSAATTGEQARIVFNDACTMAVREPSFVERFGVEVGAHSMLVRSVASVFRPLNAEGSTLDGLNIHCGIIDELHAHKKRDLYDVLDSGTGARSQPILWMINHGWQRSQRHLLRAADPRHQDSGSRVRR